MNTPKTNTTMVWEWFIMPPKEKLSRRQLFQTSFQLDVISYNVVLSLASRNAAWREAIQLAEVMATNDQAEVTGMFDVEKQNKIYWKEKEEDVVSFMSLHLWH